MSFSNADQLESIVRICHSMDLTITHTHEDLCFVEHNNFLFRLDQDDPTKAYAYMNRDCKPAERSMFEKKVLNASRVAEGLTVELAGSYSLTANEDDEEMKLEMFEGE